FPIAPEKRSGPCSTRRNKTYTGSQQGFLEGKSSSAVWDNSIPHHTSARCGTVIHHWDCEVEQSQQKTYKEQACEEDYFTCRSRSPFQCPLQIATCSYPLCE